MQSSAARLQPVIGPYEYAFLFSLGAQTLPEIERWEGKAFNDAKGFMAASFGHKEQHTKLALVTYDLRGKFADKDANMAFTYQVHAGQSVLNDLNNSNKVNGLWVVVDMNLEAMMLNFTDEDYRAFSSFKAARLIDRRLAEK